MKFTDGYWQKRAGVTVLHPAQLHDTTPGERSLTAYATAKPVRSLGIFVRPGEVIPGARGEDVHLMTEGQALRDEAAVVFGAAEDFRAVTLNDNRNSHDVTVSSICRSLGSTAFRPKSCTRRRWPAITG